MKKEAIGGTMRFQSNRPMFTKAATKDGIEYGVKLESVEIAGFHPFGEASPWTKGRGGTYQGVKVLLWLAAKLVPADGGREIPWGFSTEGPMALFIDPENNVWSFNFYPGGQGTTSFFADLKKHGFEATPTYRGEGSGGTLDDKSVLFAVSGFLTGSAFKQTNNLLTKIWRTMSPKIAGYKGNPDGADIYPIEVDHGYGEPLAGGTDVMRKLQNRLLVEQGSDPRPESPRLANLQDLSALAAAEAALGKMAMEHPTEKAKKKYLEEHPKADPADHTVAKGGDAPGAGKGFSKAVGQAHEDMMNTFAKETGIRRRLKDGDAKAVGDAKQFRLDAWNHVTKGVGKKMDAYFKKLDVSEFSDEDKARVEKAKKHLSKAQDLAKKDFGSDPDDALYVGGQMMGEVAQATGLMVDVFHKQGKRADWDPGSKTDDGWEEGKRVPDEISEGEGSLVPNILEKLSAKDALARLARLAGEDDEKEGKFEEGKPADPTKNMSPEDKAKWKDQNEKNKDKFKEASDPMAELERLASVPALAALEKMAKHRPLYEIAKEIRKDWQNPYFGAVPYLRALGEMDQVEDGYGADSGASVIAYFLSNATKWKGEKAKEIKVELNKILKGSRRGSTDKTAAANTLTIVEDFLHRDWPLVEKALQANSDDDAVGILEKIQHAYHYAAGLNEYAISLTDTSEATTGLRALIDALKKHDDDRIAQWVKYFDTHVVPEWKGILQKYRWQKGLRAEEIIALSKEIVGDAFKVSQSVGSKVMKTFFEKGPIPAKAILDRTPGRKASDFMSDLAAGKVVPRFRSWASAERLPEGGILMKEAVLDFVAADDEKEGKFEEGKPADPTENMSEEDAAKWRVQNLKNKDKFTEKEAAGAVTLRTRAGTKVQVKANPMSRAMYTYRIPADGTVGVVTPIALPGGKGTSIKGPGGGLIYVKWPDGSHFGVSPNDLELATGKSATFEDPGDGFVADCDDLVARYEEGVPADPTENMSPEDAKEWRDNTEEHKDKFKTAKQRIQFKKGDRLVVTPVPSGLAKSYPASKIKKEQTVTVLDDGFSDGLDVWDVETDDGNEDSIYGFQVKAKGKPKGKSASDVEARFEEGVPADPTVNMDPEDKAKWEDMNEEHGDKFKTASVKKWDSRFIDAETAKRLGNQRFNYKPFHELSPADQRAAVSRYPYKSVGAKYDFVDGHYYYPVDSKGALVNARAQRVLAIPYKEIQDERYMESLGYEISPKWPGGGKTAWLLRLASAHVGDELLDGIAEDQDEPEADKTAAGPGGLYGHTRRVQADCEACVRKLSRVAAKLAKNAWRKDEQVAPFLAAHAKRAGSLPAAILVESMKGLGPRVASVEIDAGASRHGLYGFSHKTAALGLQVCTMIHEAAGHFAADLHARREARRADIADFWKKHAKEAKCSGSRLLLSCWPDGGAGKKASVPGSVSDWLNVDL